MAAALSGVDVQLRRQPQEVALDLADILKLVENQFLIEISEDEVLCWARSFAVVELEKGRRRWILHPHIFNDVTDVDDIGVPFPTPEQIAQKVPRWRYGLPLDFAWFYGQFRTATGRSMAIKKDGRFFAPTTIATGARQPPLFAQLLTLAIVKKTCASEHGLCDGDAYVDNVRLLANNLTILRRLVATFFLIVGDIGITVNEQQADVERLVDTNAIQLRQYTFLGLLFDHDEKTVQLSEKSRRKLTDAHTKMQFTTTLKWREWQSIFGLCVFASNVLLLDRAKRYWVYKFMRRKSYTLVPETVQGNPQEAFVKLWPSIIDNWEGWLQEILCSRPRLIAPRGKKMFTLVTDASLSGWGAILYGPDGEHVAAGPWEPAQTTWPINLLELIAVRRALEMFASLLKDDEIALIVDNTTVIAQMTHGRSNRWRYNVQLLAIKQCLLRAKSFISSVNYIKSEKNPADFWSRLLWSKERITSSNRFLHFSVTRKTRRRTKVGNSTSSPGLGEQGVAEEEKIPLQISFSLTNRVSPSPVELTEQFYSDLPDWC